MAKLLHVVAGLCAAQALGQTPLPAFAAASDDSTYYFEVDDPPSADTVRFQHWDGLTPKLKVLVVFKAAGKAPPGVSYLVIDQQMDCARRQSSNLAVAAYAADGGLLSPGQLTADQLDALTSGGGLTTEWDFLCRMATRPAGSLPPHMVVSNRWDAPVAYEGEKAVVARARESEAAVAAAQRLPEAARFSLFAPPATPNAGALFIDMAQTQKTGSEMRASWLYVPPPAAVHSAAYVREIFSVHCDVRTGVRDVFAQYDAGSALISVTGPTAPAPLTAMGGQGEVLSEVCAGVTPGVFAKTYPTVTAALAASRQAFSKVSPAPGNAPKP